MVGPVPSGSRSVSRKNLSFLASLEQARSFKEFFLMVDATIGLDWNVEFTFLPKLYCCGSSPDCPLPKREGDADAPGAFQAVTAAEEIFAFFNSFFESAVTRDDLFVLKTKNPALYDWYREHCAEMHVGNLDNNHLMRQAELIATDFKFRSIRGIKLGPTYVENPKALGPAIEKLRFLTERIEIGGVQFAQPRTPEGTRLIGEAVSFLRARGIEHDVVSEETYEREKALGGLVSREEFDFYEEHALFFIHDRFYLNQNDHVLDTGAGFGVYGKGLEPAQFLVDMVDRKLKMYARKAPRASGALKEYFGALGERVSLNQDFTFIPRFMMNDQGPFYRKLATGGHFHDTPHGLLRAGAKAVVPLVHWS